MQISGLNPVQAWSFDERVDLGSPAARTPAGSGSGDGVDPPPSWDPQIFYSPRSDSAKKADPPRVVRVECPEGTIPTVTPAEGNAVEVQCRKPTKPPPRASSGVAPILD